MRVINELIKNKGFIISEFIPEVTGMEYRAFCISEKKGSLRVRDAVKLAAALNVSLDELLQDHAAGYNIPLSKPNQEANKPEPVPEPEIKKALTPMQELEELKKAHKQRYSKFLNS